MNSSGFDLRELTALTNRVKKAKGQVIRNSIEQFAIHQSEVTRKRYEDASRKTPYKDGHRDHFGIDTGRLLNEISQVSIRENSLHQSTDLVYARRIEYLFRLKGTLDGLIPNNPKILSILLVKIFIKYIINS